MSKIWSLIERVVRFVIYDLCKIKLDEKKWDSLMQFLKFGIVGVSNTIISYVLYTVSLLLMKKAGLWPNVDYLFAQIIAFVLSVLWSYYWNNRMVFVIEEGKTRSLWKSLIKTYISYSFTGLFLNSVLLILWVKVLGVSEFIAPIINLLVSVPLNFIINKFWAFKTSEK